jgi:hypothetical protein
MGGGAGQIAKERKIKEQVEEILFDKEKFIAQVKKTHNLATRNPIQLNGVENLLQFYTHL